MKYHRGAWRLQVQSISLFLESVDIRRQKTFVMILMGKSGISCCDQQWRLQSLLGRIRLFKMVETLIELSDVARDLMRHGFKRHA